MASKKRSTKPKKAPRSAAPPDLARLKQTRPEFSSQEIIELYLRGYEHDERVLDELEATGYRFGPDEGVICGLGDERPGEPYPGVEAVKPDVPTKQRSHKKQRSTPRR